MVQTEQQTQAVAQVVELKLATHLLVGQVALEL
jgi:hypothetical protein